MKDASNRITSEDNFIPGIFNYCDRWCERCMYTHRCRVYVTEKELTEAYEAEKRYKKSREENQKFWEQIDRALKEASETYDNLFPEEENDTLSELNFLYDDEVDEDAVNEFHKRHQQAKRHPLSVAAERYKKNVSKWFGERKERLKEDYNPKSKTLTIRYAGIEDPKIIRQLSDAGEVIRWYEIQIAVKIKRALASQLEEKEEGDFLGGFPKDSTGSASVALKGIEKSLGAWNIFYRHLKTERNTIASLITLLFLLRAELLKNFPEAPDFLWPPEEKPKTE